MLEAAQLRAFARDAGFDLVGFARATPIPREILCDWIALGLHADMDWMTQTIDKRLDVTQLLPGAKTVMALACNYWHTDEPSLIARYARGRDYHATVRDRIRALRRSVRAAFPGIDDYGTVDTNPAMERVWAARAGLGYVAKSGCFMTPQFGSYVFLATFILTAEVESSAYASGPLEDRCHSCRLCIDSCPTGAIVAERVVDSKACLSYQTIENVTAIPLEIRGTMDQIVFGCDVCQDVCPLNATPVKADERFMPRLASVLSARRLAALSRDEYGHLIPGTPLARAGFDGLRRNAAYALGVARDEGSRSLLRALARDENAYVREAAEWALAQLS